MPAKLEKTQYPGIYKRGSRHVVTWRYRGRQMRETVDTLDEALELKGEHAAGKRRPKSRKRFGVYFPEWIESYAGRTSRGFSEGTREEYRRPIEKFAMPRWFGWLLVEIESPDVRDLFADMRRKGCTTSEIKKLKAALSVLFATAHEDGLVPLNAVLGVRIPAAAEDEEPEEEKAKALTRVQLSQLLAEAERQNKLPGGKPSDWLLFFEFLTHTGLRISEVVGLRWEHLDLAGPKPHVKVREQLYKGRRKKLKSKKGKRDVPLSPGMAAKLLQHRAKHYRGPKSPVFSTTTGTEVLPSNVYRRVLAPAAIAIGLYVEIEGESGKIRKRSLVSFHTFRHTCASLLFADGRNIKQVQEWLGHADPGFTLKTYVHLMDEGVGDAAFMDDEVSVAPQLIAQAV